MAQFVVRKIENKVKAALRRRAQINRRSMEEEIREILRSAVSADETDSGGLGTEIAGLFRKVGLRADVPELRGERVRPVSF